MSCGIEIEVVAEVGSTSEVLKARAQAGGGEAALLARRQVAGQGRLGRRWWSGEGNLALSVLLRPGVLVGAGRAPGHWAIVAGVALLGAVREVAAGGWPGVELRLKWPNDLLLVGGGKVAGVLVEAGFGESAWVVIGFGVNLVVAPEGTGRTVACLADAGVALPDVVAFGRGVVASLAAWRGRYEREGFGVVRAAWLGAGPVVGEMVGLADGTAGAFAGMGEDGALLLGDGRVIRSGELA